jgi:Flp pilus assembly protein TadD
MAQSLFTEAATLFPFHASAYLGLAHAHQRAGAPDEAIREARRALELDPGNQRARTLLDALLEQR